MGKRVKIGIIGCGASTFMYAPFLKYLEDKCEFAAAVDPRIEQIKFMQKEFGAKQTYTDYKKMLKEADVDAVIVATPTYLHEEQVIESARAGKHVLCEKPMARTAQECRNMVNACGDAGVILMVAFMKRFKHSFEKVKELIGNGELGDILQVRVDWSQCEWGLRAPCSRDLMENYGGVFLDHGSHAIDLCRWWTGDIVSVYGKAWIALLAGFREVDDMAVAFMEHENGAVSIYQINLVDHKPHTEAYEICGTKASLSVSFGEFGRWQSFPSMEPYKMLLYKNDKTITDITPYSYPLRGMDALMIDKQIRDFHYCRELEHFCDCVISGTNPRVTGEDGLRTIEAINALYLSASERQAVHLPLPDDVNMQEVFETLNKSVRSMPKEENAYREKVGGLRK
jgi:predicted dehydrogenase